ncbi:hypothetical protein GCM10028822_00240 [Hymenobacter terrigena]
MNGSGSAIIRALALNAAGDVFVTGSFSREATFGATTLTSAGGTDVFVAKYVPGTHTWAWAVAGGGWDFDRGAAIAVSGTAVYVTGSFNNSLSNTTGAQFGGLALPGASTDYVYGDIFLAKYTDANTSAQFNWAVAAGGTQGDYAAGIALSGSSIYLTGALSNNMANANRVQFSGTTVNGASTTTSQDLFLAKYTDINNSPIFNWAVTGGGTRDDAGTSLAVSGTSLYITGSLTNSRTNANQARFGGQSLNGGSSSDLYPDMLLVKYTDVNTSAQFNWGTVGGGTFVDQGNSLAVNGTSIYLTGAFSNSTTNGNQVDFSGTPLNGMYTNGFYQDIFLAKYTDLGTAPNLNWVTAAGGSGDDQGYGLAVEGPRLFITGRFSNSSTNVNQVTFGNMPLNGVYATSSSELFVAQYTDAGTAPNINWAVAGGGAFDERGYAVGRNAAGVYVVGQVGVPATFGSYALPGVNSQTGLLARLGGGVLPTRLSSPNSEFALYPNPARGQVTIELGNAAAPTELILLDALGQVVRHVTIGGASYVLKTGALAPGVYTLHWVERGQALTKRLMLE